LLVHRPRYDDWTFPKGKADPGEPDEDCALREVREETGFVCRLGEELPSTFYLDSRGRKKRVRYWQMQVDAGEFVPTAEVDAIRWCTTTEASELLSYARDRDLLGKLTE
jgi:8-oxo-dGTP pyrophosphatase MutT (NUDIX family)